MKDFYYILGTDRKSTPAEISEAYNKLALKLKPGLHDDDYFIQNRFKDLGEAYNTLSDPLKRRLYDEAVRRMQQKRLSGFKANHLGMFAVGAFILFTGLFGFYVWRLLAAKKAAKITEVVAAAQPVKIKHHKKKHHLKQVMAATARPVLFKKEITSAANSKPPVIVADIPAVVRPVAVIPAPVIKPDSTYNTILKADLAGLVYVHQQDDYMSAVVTVLPHRSRIKVLQKGANFYKIAFNDQVGYIPKWTITKQ